MECWSKGKVFKIVFPAAQTTILVVMLKVPFNLCF